MKQSRFNSTSLLVALLYTAGAIAANTTEPLSALPLAPGFTKTGDPVQSYTFCGKSARSVAYIGGGISQTWTMRTPGTPMQCLAH
jgi:hypothetical protein